MKRLVTIILSWWTVLLPLQAIAAGITEAQVQNVIHKLDSELDIADRYIERRQMSIDSLKQIFDTISIDEEPNMWFSYSMQIADSYTSFNADSAITYYDQAYNHAIDIQLDSIAMAFRLKRATYLPLIGLTSEAINEYESISPDSLSQELLELYYASGYQLYIYSSSYFTKYSDIHNKWVKKAVNSQAHLIRFLDISSPRYKLLQGTLYYANGERSKAKVILEELIATIPAESNIYARATHSLANIAKDNDDSRGYIYYLALSAIADIKTATLEVTSLQDLGVEMYEYGDVDRAHTYLSRALANAVQCHAMMRMIQSSESLPIIDAAHITELNALHQRMYGVIAIMALLLIGLVVALILLRRDIKRMSVLQQRLEKANHAKEVYISQFLNLCSIYMDKLNQFCKIANRKISTGKVDDLYKLTKSGKFVEEQSKEFYDVFDNAFLHIYPGFVKSVNSLLRPGEQIELKPGELLNTDLRILAFMRLGIEEGTRIAQVLNYSVYTIYTYRNKLKNRALNRDTFESDIMKISSVS